MTRLVRNFLTLLTLTDTRPNRLPEHEPIHPAIRDYFNPPTTRIGQNGGS